MEYTERLYNPIAERGGRLVADDQKRARELASWRAHVARAWPGVSFREADEDQGAAGIGDRRDVSVLVHLGELSTSDVQVELLHGAVQADGGIVDPVTTIMEPVGEEAPGTHRYQGSFSCELSGEYGFTVRVVPRHEDLSTWTSTGLVAWAGDHLGESGP